MSGPILSVKGLVKRFGGLVATDNVTLDVRPGEIHALIGPNGAGKTTLISQLVGELRPDAGTIELEGRGIGGLSTARRIRLGLARTFQITCLLPEYSVLDNVAIAIQIRQGHSFRFWGNVRHDKALREAAIGFLDTIGLAPRADEQVANLCRSTIVEDAWARGQKLMVHGWVYSLKDGRVSEMGIDVGAAEDLKPAYESALAFVPRHGRRD